MTTTNSSTRDRILAAAGNLFASQGFHRTSTREIADAVGIRQPSLFYHFPTKGDIMKVLLCSAIDGALEVVEEELAREGSPAERLHRYIVGDLLATCRSPYNLAGTTTQAVLGDPEFQEAAGHYQKLFDARTQLIQLGIDAGEFLPVNASFASRAIEWAIEGLSTEIGADTPDDLETDAGAVADFCVRALLVDGSQIAAIRSAEQQR